MASEQEKRLHRHSKVVLSRCSKLLEELLDKTPSIERLQLAIEDFEVKLTNYDDHQSVIELSMISEEEIEREVEDGSKYREEKIDVLCKAKKLFEELNCASEKKKAEKTESVVNSEAAGTSCVRASLPKLELPCFSGDPLEWMTFWDQFSAIVDLRNDMDDVNKFSYLMGRLEGEARSCLQGLALTKDNYHHAKTLLHQRFGRREKIIVHHIQKLLNISQSSSKNLWGLYDSVQIHTRSLKNLGIAGENYGFVLAPTILHQLPGPIRLEWARQSEGHEGDLEYLLDFLLKEIQFKEKSQTFETQRQFRHSGSNAALFNGEV